MQSCPAETKKNAIIDNNAKVYGIGRNKTQFKKLQYF